MNEITFLVEEVPEGGFTARALGVSIFTEAYSIADVLKQANEAAQCHINSRNKYELITVFSESEALNRKIVECMLRNGDKISAIRTYRKQSNAELADTMRAIHRIQDEIGI